MSPREWAASVFDDAYARMRGCANQQPPVVTSWLKVCYTNEPFTALEWNGKAWAGLVRTERGGYRLVEFPYRVDAVKVEVLHEQ